MCCGGHLGFEGIQRLAPRVMLRGFLRCDFPSLASRRCSSKTVYFVITAKKSYQQ